MAFTAVITADIVNSTQLPKTEAKKIMKGLLELLQPHAHEFYRGDSFQVLVKTPAEALSLLLQLRTTAIKLSPAGSPLADIRSSIAIGVVKHPVRSLKTATDEAFITSGRAFDKMEKHQRLVIHCQEKNTSAQIGFNVIAHFIDYLFLRLTSKQATVVFELLMKRTQTETAKRLKKSQATIHKHIYSAGWPEIEQLLKNYRLLITTIEA
ncbi:MAG TPA: hypothetical protein VFQ73_17560 [Flavisolibacter sp.]|nr:hypothetical protein [Flavisolibacter sp.]